MGCEDVSLPDTCTASIRAEYDPDRNREGNEQSGMFNSTTVRIRCAVVLFLVGQNSNKSNIFDLELCVQV